MEIIFTSFESVAVGDFRLMARTSLLMFPIYGLGALLGPMTHRLDQWLGDSQTIRKKDRFWRHGIHDMVLIFSAEYLFGALLRLASICPWDYSGRFFSVDGLIRLDFAPLWFCAGLIFEAITGEKTEADPVGIPREESGLP